MTSPIGAVIGGSVTVAMLSVVMLGFSLRHEIIDDTLLFPATMLAATMLLALSAVLIGESALVLVPVIGAAALINIGCTLGYLQRVLGH